MAKKSKTQMKIISIILMVAGVGMACWGYQMSGSFSSSISKTITGSYSDKVMALCIGGAVSFVIGLYLNIKK